MLLQRAIADVASYAPYYHLYHSTDRFLGTHQVYVCSKVTQLHAAPNTAADLFL